MRAVTRSGRSGTVEGSGRGDDSEEHVCYGLCVCVCVCVCLYIFCLFRTYPVSPQQQITCPQVRHLLGEPAGQGNVCVCVCVCVFVCVCVCVSLTEGHRPTGQQSGVCVWWCV